MYQKKSGTDSNTKKNHWVHKNTALFLLFSAVRHIRDRNIPRRKLISASNIHPEMTVSEAG